MSLRYVAFARNIYGIVCNTRELLFTVNGLSQVFILAKVSKFG